jgi:hypothetical protein
MADLASELEDVAFALAKGGETLIEADDGVNFITSASKDIIENPITEDIAGSGVKLAADDVNELLDLAKSSDTFADDVGEIENSVGAAPKDVDPTSPDPTTQADAMGAESVDRMTNLLNYLGDQISGAGTTTKILGLSAVTLLGYSFATKECTNNGSATVTTLEDKHTSNTIGLYYDVNNIQYSGVDFLTCRASSCNPTINTKVSLSAGVTTDAPDGTSIEWFISYMDDKDPGYLELTLVDNSFKITNVTYYSGSTIQFETSLEQQFRSNLGKTLSALAKRLKDALPKLPNFWIYIYIFIAIVVLLITFFIVRAFT